MSVVEPIRVTLQVQENSPITVNSNILPRIIEGISPEVSLEETADGVVMTVTDKSGTETALIPKGPQGDDYVLTEEDKTEIATQAAEMVDVTGKADKVTGAVTGNFAGLDANGNLTDSGKKPGDFLTEHQDLSGKADKADTVLTTTLSLGRQANTTVGTGSVALGTKLEASGDYSLAQGYNTHATAAYAHSEGMGTYAEAGYTHAEGGWTRAKKYGAHAEGGSTVADAPYSHTEGYGTKAAGTSQHVSGEYNVVNAPAAGEDYAEFVEIVGNGDGDNDRSNARTLDWDGNERLAGDLYIGCNNDSTGGTAVGTALAGKQAKITASGLLKGDGNGGVTAATEGADYGTYSKPSGGIPAADLAAGVIPDPEDLIDDTAGTGDTDKVWSADKSAQLLSAITAMEPPAYDATSTYSVGDIVWYSNKMYRCNTAISTAEEWTAAHWTEIILPKDVRVNGMSVVGADGVANVPLASTSEPGVIIRGDGFWFNPSNNKLYVNFADDNQIKAGTSSVALSSVAKQYKSVFYGLSKVAGVDLASETVTLGTYPAAAKIAIQKMLGIYEAPWELIREDKVTNETQADVEITVDGNGNAFELTSTILLLLADDSNSNTTVADTDVYFYYGSSYVGITTGTINHTAGATGIAAMARAINENNLLTLDSTYRGNVSGTSNIQIRMYYNISGTYQGIRVLNEPIYFDKIKICKLTGPLKYKLIGKRKWTV